MGDAHRWAQGEGSHTIIFEEDAIDRPCMEVHLAAAGLIVSSLSFSTDGEKLAALATSSSWWLQLLDSVVRAVKRWVFVWDTSTYELVSQFRIRSYECDPPARLAFLENDEILMCGTPKIKTYWQVATGKELVGRREEVPADEQDFYSGARTLYEFFDYGFGAIAAMGIYNAIVAKAHGALDRFLITPDGSLLVALTSDGRSNFIERWDANTLREQKLLSLPGPETVACAAFSSDGTLFLARGRDIRGRPTRVTGQIEAWHIGAGFQLTAFHSGRGVITDLAISPHNILAVGTKEHVLVYPYAR